MPAKKKAAAQADDQPAKVEKESKAPPPDEIPTAKTYDPAKHANHSHLNP